MEPMLGPRLRNAVASLKPDRANESVVTGARLPEGTVLVVRDPRRGIAAAAITGVFQPFRRVGRQDGTAEDMASQAYVTPKTGVRGAWTVMPSTA